MTYYIARGNTFHISPKGALDIREELPVGTYIIRQDPMTMELYLEATEGFKKPSKLYGNVQSRADRVLNTFFDRPSGTGLFLSGDKGSGKSLLAKQISLTAMDAGVPTILINQPLMGEGFNRFIQSIQQEAVILFDEFEKTYFEQRDQEVLLTLFDGVFPSKKLFILTVNDHHRVTDLLMNRPGRMLYHLAFKGLDEGFIREYLEDNLNDKSYIETIVRMSSLFSSFNFDILKALVEEMNRYNESPEEVMQFLNASPDGGSGKEFSMKLLRNGVDITEVLRDGYGSTPSIRTVPLIKSVGIGFYEDADHEDEDIDDLISLHFAPTDLEVADISNGVFKYKTDARGYTLTLTEIKPEPYNMMRYVY